jgi:hypothetical protein
MPSKIYIEREERKDERRTVEAVDLINKFSYLESVSNVLEPFFTERECEMARNDSNLRFYDEKLKSASDLRGQLDATRNDLSKASIKTEHNVLSEF